MTGAAVSASMSAASMPASTARLWRLPTVRPRQVNLARRRQAKPHVSVKYLETDFTDLFLNSLFSYRDIRSLNGP